MNEPDFDWLHPEKEPIQTTSIKPSDFTMPSEAERLRSALLTIADMANRMAPGEYMVVLKHDPIVEADRRLFTVKIYSGALGQIEEERESDENSYRREHHS